MPQIHSMLLGLEWKHEVFASAQTYDADGNITHCPLYFDLDGNPDDVHRDAKEFVQACEFGINVTPKIFFSGKKGFHLVIDHLIVHPRCHELVKDFAREIAGHIRTVDEKVYRPRSLFRIPGSPASQRGHYKIELTRAELFQLSFDQIRELSTRQRFIETDHDPSKIDVDAYEAWLKLAIAKLPKPNTINKLSSYNTNVTMEMTPCIATMFEKPPVEGERNVTVYILSKFLKSCDVDEDTALGTLLGYEHFRQFESEGREVSKIVRSVYKSQKASAVGCRDPHSQYAAQMRSYCDTPCPFRSDFDHRPYCEHKYDWTEP